MPKAKTPSRIQELTPAPADPLKFPDPIFLEGEDEALYRRLFDQVTAAVSPRDIIEKFWVHDIVELMWEAFRLRRLKVSLLNANARRGLKHVLDPLTGYGEASDLADAWHARNTAARKAVKRALKQAGLTMDAVMAETLSLKLDETERIERMIAAAEARRASILREIDRHRAALATSRTTQAIEDAEFTEVTQATSTHKAA